MQPVTRIRRKKTIMSGSDSSAGFAAAQEPLLLKKEKAFESPLIPSSEDSENVVPNYRVAPKGGFRTCEGCLFFKGTECSYYEFPTKPHFLCDTWQNAPSESDEKINVGWGQSIDANAPKSMLSKNGTSVVNSSDKQSESVINSAEQEFKSGNLVYCKSLRVFGIVNGSSTIDGIRYIQIKTLNAGGEIDGVAITQDVDLQIKGEVTAKSIKTVGYYSSSAKEIPLNAEKEVAKKLEAIGNQLKGLVDKHLDYVAEPLSNKNILNPLKLQIDAALADPIFADSSTGEKRKYWRALQTAQSSIGAGRQVLMDCYRYVNYMRSINSDDQTLGEIMLRAQKGAYDRLCTAYEAISSVFTIESSSTGKLPPK